MKPLERKIVATVAYYNELSYPLTSFEVYQHLLNYGSSQGAVGDKYNLFQITSVLDSGSVRQYLEEYRGFYFLKGRKKLVRGRILRNKIASAKLEQLSVIVKMLSWVPFVRAVTVTGRLAMKNAQRRSDWDVLVVLGASRIWLGRTLVTLMVWLLGKRRTDRKTKDRVCLNYFITDKSLEIGLKDFFSASEYSFTFPLLGWSIFRDFQSANSWIAGFHPNWTGAVLPGRLIHSPGKAADYWRAGLEKLLDCDYLENFLKKIELKKIAQNPKTKQAGGMVAADDQALIFLPSPQGPHIFENFKKRLQVLGL